MQRFKKALRLCLLVIIIFLASLGVSISGGIPVKPSGRKEDKGEAELELVVPEEESGSSVQSVPWQ